MKTLLTLLALFSLAASAQAPEEIYYQELIEWVFQPCMEMATALEVKNMDQETRDIGLTRAMVAKVMLAGREDRIRGHCQRKSG